MAFKFTAGKTPTPNQPSPFQSFPLVSAPEPVTSLYNSVPPFDDDAPPPPLSLAPAASVSNWSSLPPPPPLSLSASVSNWSSLPPAPLSLAPSESIIPPPLPLFNRIYVEDSAFYSHLSYYFDHCLEVVDQSDKPFSKGEAKQIDDFLYEMRHISYSDIQNTQIRNRFDPNFIGRIYKNPVSKHLLEVDFSPRVIEQDRIIHRKSIMQERVQFFVSLLTKMNREYKMGLMYYMLWVMNQLFRLYDHVNGTTILFDEHYLSLDFLENFDGDKYPKQFAQRELLLRSYLAHQKSDTEKEVDKVILAKLMKTWAIRVINSYFRPIEDKNNILESIVWCISIESILLWLCTTTPRGIAITESIEAKRQEEATVVGKNKNLGNLGKGGEDVLKNIFSFLGRTRKRGKCSKKQSLSKRRMEKKKSRLVNTSKSRK